jgi:hypothetical protein
MDRSRIVTTILLIVIVLLAGQTFWQQRRISRLQSSMQFQQQQFEQQASKLAAEKLKHYRADVMNAAQWLHHYYASPEGLKRPDGLWRADQKQPDFEAFGAWVIDVYLNARVEGQSDEAAKQLIINTIQGSDEWKRVHAVK